MPDVLTLHAEAPDFCLPADDGRTYRLSEYRGRSAVLLFFYPGDFTPVCTAEVTAFRDDYDHFREQGIILFGISSDPVERHHRFAEECRIPFRLLSDASMEVSRLYGARGLLGTRRAYYYIDREGLLRWQHAEILPIFKLSNRRILDHIAEVDPQAGGANPPGDLNGT